MIYLFFFAADNVIMHTDHQFWEEYGRKPVSEVSGLTIDYPANTLRLVFFCYI